MSSYSLNWFDTTALGIYGIISQYKASKTVHFVLRFCEALLRLLNPTDKKAWCLDLYFPLWSIWIYDVNNKVGYFCMLQIMHLPLLKNKTNKKTTGTSHKMFSWWKETHVGMKSSKTNQTHRRRNIIFLGGHAGSFELTELEMVGFSPACDSALVVVG